MTEQEDKLEYQKDLQKMKEIIEKFDFKTGSPSLAGYLSKKVMIESRSSENSN